MAPLLAPPPRPLLIHSQGLRSDIGVLLVPGLPPEQCTFDQMEREARPAKLVCGDAGSIIGAKPATATLT